MAPVRGEIVTGAAYAGAKGVVEVGQQSNGCCDEGPSCGNPCMNPCGGFSFMPQTRSGDTDLNFVSVSQRIRARAETGENRLTVTGGSGGVYTGGADAVGEGYVRVNAQTNDVVNVQVNGLMN